MSAGCSGLCSAESGLNISKFSPSSSKDRGPTEQPIPMPDHPHTLMVSDTSGKLFENVLQTAISNCFWVLYKYLLHTELLQTIPGAIENFSEIGVEFFSLQLLRYHNSMNSKEISVLYYNYPKWQNLFFYKKNVLS